MTTVGKAKLTLHCKDCKCQCHVSVDVVGRQMMRTITVTSMETSIVSVPSDNDQVSLLKFIGGHMCKLLYDCVG